MRVILTQPLKISDTLTAAIGQELDLDEGTARSLIAAKRAKKAPVAKENSQAAARTTKPRPGPSETK